MAMSKYKTGQFLTLLILLFLIHGEGKKSEQNENEDEEVQDSEKTQTKLLPCDEEKLMMYLAELQAINPESVVNLATKEPVDHFCKKIKKSISKIDNYTSSCDPPHDNDLYMQLINGVHAMNHKLCDEKKFSKTYSKYLNCFMELHDELEDCVGPADWEERRDQKIICKTYEEISDCYFTKTAVLCGKKAARTLKTLLVHVFDSIVDIKCKHLGREPVVEDAMPDDINRGLVLTPLFFVIASISIIQSFMILFIY